MAMTQLPQITAVNGGKFWCADTFDTFRVKVFVPDCELPADIINYGSLPYTDFIRTQTLCQSGTMCDFRFVRHAKGEQWQCHTSV